MSEIYNIHDEIISLWIRQAVYFDGNFKVSNSGNSYLLVNKGKPLLCQHGHVKRYIKSPEKLENILKRLVTRYQNFEHNGYMYYFSRGEWRRFQKKE